MASAGTDLLVGKLVAIPENVTSSIVYVRDEIDEIKHELVSMKSFLQDAEGKNAYTEKQKIWVASVRDLAGDAKDIIDEFMYHVYQQQSWGQSTKWLQKTINTPRNLWSNCS